MNKITTENYFDTVKQVGVENLPLVLKQVHTVITEKMEAGNNWDEYKNNPELKRMVDTAFKKLEEFINSTKKIKSMNGLDDTTPKRKKENPYSKIVKEVQFIQRFLEFHDKVLYKNTFGIFIDDLQKAIQEKKITKKSAVAKEILEIQQAAIYAFNTMYNAKHFVLNPDTIKRFKSIIEKYDNAHDDIDKDYVKTKKKSLPLEGIVKPDENIMCSTDFANLQFASIGFKDKWLDFIGDPAPGFTAMVYGKPKMGKSYLCVDFAGYLAQNHGKVLYVAKEEKLDATLQRKLKDKDVANSNLFVADNLPKNISEYQFVILDSVNKLGLNPQDLAKLKTDNPGICFVYVFQATKEGKFRGNNEFQHDVDVVIEVPKKGIAIQNGRFNQGGEMDIFKDAPAAETEGLNGIKKNRKNSEDSKKTSKKINKAPDWSEPKHLDQSDWQALKTIKKYCDMGKFEEAMNYARQNCDTVIREEIPGDIWKKMGGQLTKTGEEKLNKSDNLDKFKNRPDDLNPNFIFTLTATQLLCEALKDDFDINYLIRQELAGRGQDKNGNWIGFDKAREIHKI